VTFLAGQAIRSQLVTLNLAGDTTTNVEDLVGVVPDPEDLAGVVVEVEDLTGTVDNGCPGE